MNSIEQTKLTPIIFPVWFLLNVVLCYHRNVQHFSYWWVQGIFLKDFHACIIAVKSISLHLVFVVWKFQMNNTALIPPYTLHNFSSTKLCLCSRPWRFILDNQWKLFMTQHYSLIWVYFESLFILKNFFTV